MCNTCWYYADGKCTNHDIWIYGHKIVDPNLSSCCLWREKDERIEEPTFDAVSRPSHYTEGRKYEPKDVIRDWGLNFNLGNTVKYVARAGRKDEILVDLRKARQYLDFEIEYLEKNKQ